MENHQSPLEYLSTAFPEAVIETVFTAKAVAIGFRRGGESVWLAIDRHPSHDEGLDNIVTSLANTLALCENCPNDLSSLCRGERRIMARRLQKFLGVEGYHTFLSHAPLGGRFPAEEIREPKESTDEFEELHPELFCL